MAALVRNILYQNEIHAIYDTRWCGHFCNLMKVFGNKKGFHDRSVFRNIVFDCFRCLLRPIIFPLMFNEGINFDFLLEMSIGTVIMSVVSTLWIRKSFFEVNRVAWA
jgi:hypothetical protein